MLMGGNDEHMAEQASAGYYLDEEECLSFPVFVAELELLMGITDVRKGGVTAVVGPANAHNTHVVHHGAGQHAHKPDLAALLELLQKMASTIPRTQSVVLRQHQRACEDWLYGLLQQGCGAVVSPQCCTIRIIVLYALMICFGLYYMDVICADCTCYYILFFDARACLKTWQTPSLHLEGCWPAIKVL